MNECPKCHAPVNDDGQYSATGWMNHCGELRAEIAALKAEIERLQKRDMNASITLAYNDGDNPFAREDLKIVDVGAADNGYVVESKVVTSLQTRIAELEEVVEAAKAWWQRGLSRARFSSPADLRPVSPELAGLAERLEALGGMASDEGPRAG